MSLWDRAKAIYIMSLKSEDERSQAERYLSMITRVSCFENVFTIYTTSALAQNIIQSDYANKLKGSFMVAGASEEIKLCVRFDETYVPPVVNNAESAQSSAASSSSVNGSTAPVRPSTFVSTMPLNEDYTFEKFVSGPSNSYALSAAEGVVKNPGKAYNPLFIHGGTGLGKTHLMQAIGNRLKELHPEMSICYLTAECFMNEYINSLQGGQSKGEFRKKYRSLDVLLLDDVQFLQKGQGVQEEFFNTFNELRDIRHKQIVMTCDVAPKNIPTMSERLSSRFEGGMVQEIESPSYETRLAILKSKAANFDVRVPNNVLEFIADNIKSHVRAMEGALAKVCISISAAPDIKLENEVLAHILKDFIEKEQTLRKITIQEIQQACAKKYGITIKEILSHERTQSLVTPRQLAMLICRKCTSKGLKEIADAFDKKHATLISGIRTITERLSNEPELKSDLEEILTSFGYRLSDVMQ